MTKVFKTPFAAQGDRTDVPVEAQADGSVSYTQGYGYDYERDQASDPAAKDIEREKMNALFHDVTEAVGDMQTFGAATWSDEGKPYPIRSLVYFSKRIWQSRIENNNTQPGTGNDWIELKADVNPVDGLYPVGIVVWFAQNKNPNTLFPGTTWKYIGENRTVRLAAATGADVMATGGSDSVTLAVGNLPAHGHTFSANTSSFDYGSKSTNSAGAHTHTIPYGGSVQSGGSNYGVPRSDKGATTTSSSGNHAHTVAIGAHSHSVSGTTANTGSGSAINVTNSYIKLMGWYRTA